MEKETWRINLRHDQQSYLIGTPSVSNSEVTIYAPTWVKEGLSILSKELKEIEFKIFDTNPSEDPNKENFVQSFTLKEEVTLEDLQKISRNEDRNVTGIIRWDVWFSPRVNKKLVYSLKDLVRQCIIVGKDMTTHYGGYGSGCPRESQEKAVYICDLAALQFQQNYNSGRLVLIEEGSSTFNSTKGILDDFIFQKVVSEEKKKSFDEIEQEINQNPNGEASKRYILCLNPGLFKKCYFDSFAYKKFVKLDVILSGRALSELALKNGDRINFKFLKYGTGFFAGNFREETNKFILDGVLDGLEELFEKYETKVKGTIECVEFPHYQQDTIKESKERLERFKEKYKVDFRFSRDDALKSNVEGLVTATTNCGDSHTVCGNEMGFGSVDAAIASNLQSKANIFSPILNPFIKEKFIEML